MCLLVWRFLLAYLASLYATMTSGGDIYFESITMFVFFLLLGRYVEMRVRHRNELLGDGFSQGLPITASLLARATESKATFSSLSSRATGDRLQASNLAYKKPGDPESSSDAEGINSDANTLIEVPVKTLQQGDVIRGSRRCDITLRWCGRRRAQVLLAKHY